MPSFHRSFRTTNLLPSHRSDTMGTSVFIMGAALRWLLVDHWKTEKAELPSKFLGIWANRHNVSQQSNQLTAENLLWRILWAIIRMCELNKACRWFGFYYKWQQTFNTTAAEIRGCPEQLCLSLSSSSTSCGSLPYKHYICLTKQIKIHTCHHWVSQYVIWAVFISVHCPAWKKTLVVILTIKNTFKIVMKQLQTTWFFLIALMFFV